MVRHAADPVVTYRCEGCGLGFDGPRRGPGRPTTRYCSILCREYHKHDGRWASELPARHPARGWRPPPAAPAKPRAALIICGWCGDTYQQQRAHSRYCSRRCIAQQKAARRRARSFGATGDYTWADVTRLWICFDRTCAYCRSPLALADLQAEHVVPLSRGGANSPTNLLPSCGSCNADKRDLTLTDWATDRARRDLPPVVTAWADDDPRYRHLTSTRGPADRL